MDDWKINKLAAMNTALHGNKRFEYLPINDRLIKIIFYRKPAKIYNIQVYMPIPTALDEEIERIYKDILQARAKIPMKEPFLIMGDWNSKMRKVDSSYL